MANAEETVTVEVALPRSLLEPLDDYCDERAYLDRDEAIRAAVRASVLDGPVPVSDDVAALEYLVTNGCSPAPAVDYLMCEVLGRSPLDWADQKGVSNQAVYENISVAEEALENAAEN